MQILNCGNEQPEVYRTISKYTDPETYEEHLICK